MTPRFALAALLTLAIAAPAAAEARPDRTDHRSSVRDRTTADPGRTGWQEGISTVEEHRDGLCVVVRKWARDGVTYQEQRSCTLRR